jgi:hypothetical protein
MNWKERISVDPAVRSGKPCVKGTRMTAYDVLEYLAGGMTEREILADSQISVPTTSGPFSRLPPPVSGAFRIQLREAAVRRERDPRLVAGPP